MDRQAEGAASGLKVPWWGGMYGGAHFMDAKTCSGKPKVTATGSLESALDLCLHLLLSS